MGTGHKGVTGGIWMGHEIISTNLVGPSNISYANGMGCETNIPDLLE